MPPGDPGLIDHEWVKHGTCTGLDMAEYFRRIKQAAEKVRIPPELQGPHLPVDSDFKAIAAMFRAVNPGLTEDMLEIIADRGGRISEVHVCFDKQLEFQTCPSTRRRTGGRFLPVQ
jgi:ribonuclease T2